jgi:hypothetical protein
MGAEQSTAQAGTYQPDFLTAHVKKVSHELAPKKTPLKGFSSVGGDSMHVTAGKRPVARVVSTPESRLTQQQQLTPPTGAQSYIETEMRSISQSLAQRDRPQPLAAPTVGGDAFHIQHVKKEQQHRSTAPRNRFGLADGPGKEEMFAKKMGGNPEALRPKQCADAYETGFAQTMKTQLGGTAYDRYEDGHARAFRSPDVGKVTGVKNDHYYIGFAKTTHSWLAPKTAPHVVEEWRGIKPNIPVDDYTRSELKEKRGAISDADYVQPMPTPSVGLDAYMFKIAKAVGVATSTSPLRSKEMDENLYNPADSLFTAPKPTKDSAEEYQGVKANVGADSFMNTFAKEAHAQTPTKLEGREVANLPPKENELLSA